MPFKINFIILWILTLFFTTSCLSEPKQIDILIEAESLLNEKPDKALTLLYSIYDAPSLGQKSYMDYILAITQAKYDLKKDITHDTLIFNAARYYELNKNMDKAALANFYAARIYFEQKIYDNSLLCYQTARQQTHDDKLTARILNNIGFTYFQQDLMDSAIVYYKQALIYYGKYNNLSESYMRTLNYLGRSYVSVNSLDKAFECFENGLYLAKQNNNKLYESYNLQNIGVVYRRKGNYSQAIQNFHMARALSSSVGDSIKAEINLAKVYVNIKQKDSVLYYQNLALSKIDRINDFYVSENVFRTVSEYYNELKDYKQALKYSQLQRLATDRIVEDRQIEQIYEANTRYLLNKGNSNSNDIDEGFFIILTSFFSILLLIILGLGYLIYKKQKQHLKNYEDQLREYESLKLMQCVYADLFSGVQKVGIKSNSSNNTQLKEWVDRYILKQDYGEIIMSVLDESELILFVLYSFEYNDMEIEHILLWDEYVLTQRKMELRKKLVKMDLRDTEVRRVISSLRLTIN